MYLRIILALSICTTLIALASAGGGRGRFHGGSRGGRRFRGGMGHGGSHSHSHGDSSDGSFGDDSSDGDGGGTFSRSFRRRTGSSYDIDFIDGGGGGRRHGCNTGCGGIDDSEEFGGGIGGRGGGRRGGGGGRRGGGRGIDGDGGFIGGGRGGGFGRGMGMRVGGRGIDIDGEFIGGGRQIGGGRGGGFGRGMGRRVGGRGIDIDGEFVGGGRRGGNGRGGGFGRGMGRRVGGRGIDIDGEFVGGGRRGGNGRGNGRRVVGGGGDDSWEETGGTNGGEFAWSIWSKRTVSGRRTTGGGMRRGGNYALRYGYDASVSCSNNREVDRVFEGKCSNGGHRKRGRRCETVCGKSRKQDRFGDLAEWFCDGDDCRCAYCDLGDDFGGRGSTGSRGGRGSTGSRGGRGSTGSRGGRRTGSRGGRGRGTDFEIGGGGTDYEIERRVVERRRGNGRNGRRRRAGTGTRFGSARCARPYFDSFACEPLCEAGREQKCEQHCRKHFNGRLSDAACEDGDEGAECVCLSCRTGTNRRRRRRNRARNAVCSARPKTKVFDMRCRNENQEDRCIDKCLDRFKGKLVNAYCAEDACYCETCPKRSRSRGEQKKRRQRRLRKERLRNQCVDTTMELFRGCNSDAHCQSQCEDECGVEDVDNAFCSRGLCACEACVSRDSLQEEEREYVRRGGKKDIFYRQAKFSGGFLSDIFESLFGGFLRGH